MPEATASETTRRAFEDAHKERAAAFAAFLSFPFRVLSVLRWPQGSARRWSTSPQGCPVGQ